MDEEYTVTVVSPEDLTADAETELKALYAIIGVQDGELTEEEAERYVQGRQV